MGGWGRGGAASSSKRMSSLSVTISPPTGGDQWAPWVLLRSPRRGSTSDLDGREHAGGHLPLVPGLFLTVAEHGHLLHTVGHLKVWLEARGRAGKCRRWNGTKGSGPACFSSSQSQIFWQYGHHCHQGHLLGRSAALSDGPWSHFIADTANRNQTGVE
jgi:hypothetical protein